MLNDGGVVNNIYLDIVKAFDSVSPYRLIVKMQSYGIASSAVELIKSFIMTRRQNVVITGSESKWFL